MNADVPQIVQCLVNAQARLFYGTKTILPKIAARNTRGPILFKFVRVDYDKDQGRLKLSKGEFAGHEVIRSGDRDAGENRENTQEYVESIVGSEEEETGKEIGQLYITFTLWNI